FPARPDFPAPNQPRGMNLRDVFAAIAGIPDAILGDNGPVMSASRALNRGIDAVLNPAPAPPPRPVAIPPVPETVTPNGGVVWAPCYAPDHNKDQSRHPAFPRVVPGASAPPLAAIPPGPAPIRLSGSAPIGTGASPSVAALKLPSDPRFAGEGS